MWPHGPPGSTFWNSSPLIRECSLAQCPWGGKEANLVRGRLWVVMQTWQLQTKTQALELKWPIGTALHWAKMDSTFNQSAIMYHIWHETIALNKKKIEVADGDKPSLFIFSRNPSCWRSFDQIFPKQNLWSDRASLDLWSFYPLPQAAP